MPGNDVSVPDNPSLCELNLQILAMIESGRLTLGEQCAPYQLTRYVPENGKLIPREVYNNLRKENPTARDSKAVTSQARKVHATSDRFCPSYHV